MEDTNSALLPYILQVLSRKPHMSDTLDNLCKDVKAQLAKENQLSKYKNLPRSLEEALEVGQDLGIVYLTNEAIRLPFNIRTTKKKSAVAPDSTKDVDNRTSKKPSDCKNPEQNCSTELMFPKRRGPTRRRYVRGITSDAARRRRRTTKRRRSSSRRRRGSRRRR